MFIQNAFTWRIATVLVGSATSGFGADASIAGYQNIFLFSTTRAV
jgi:hypothetical protein